MRNAEKTIGNFICKQSVSFIGSVDEDGFPNMKAMLAPRKIDGIKYIYYSTNTSSERVKQFLSNNKACVYFYDKRFFRGVMLKGTMEVITQGEIKNELWRDGDTLFYPLGITDPDYCVLKFTATSGRYYSNLKAENFNL